MNIIFLDFDGVLYTSHDNSKEALEKRISILGDICKEFDCSVVIEASIKREIDEKTLRTDIKWVKEIFELFKKYNIKCIDRTPNIGRNSCVKGKKALYYTHIPIWKEDEIRVYLFNHPEIEHYAVIDDDDLAPHRSDLNQVRDHLVETIFYSENPEEEGLLEIHKDKVREVLEKENEVRKFAGMKKSR